MGKCPNLFEMAWIYRRFTTGQSPYFKYRRKVTNRGKTDVLSKPLKRRIRMESYLDILLYIIKVT
jgi:hypothetical protein